MSAKVWISYTREYGYNTRKTVKRRVSLATAQRIAEIAISGRESQLDIIRLTVWKGKQSDIALVQSADVLCNLSQYGRIVNRSADGFPCVRK
jgi:hypothetical protein